jgi:pilus assembly protein CpaF
LAITTANVNQLSYLHVFRQLYSILNESNAEEILVNGSRGAFLVHPSSGHLPFKLNLKIDEMVDACQMLAFEQSRRLDATQPFCGGDIPTLNLRWHAVIPPATSDEILLSIRKMNLQVLELSAFKYSDQALNDITQTVTSSGFIVIGGATGSGKTSFLLSLLKHFYFQSRVLILESIPEIPCLSPSWARLNSVSQHVNGRGSVSLSQLAKECLRLRPDVFVIGEIRGDEALVLKELLNTGTQACLTTIHSSNHHASIRRLRALSGCTGESSTVDLSNCMISLNRPHLRTPPLVDTQFYNKWSW